MRPPVLPSPEERFTALFNQTRLPLLAYAVRRVADPADAADVVAETYLVAWRRLDDVPLADQARPWLFGVARRVLANHHRGERRRNALADRLRGELEATAPHPGTLLDPTDHGASDITERVLRAVDLLSDDDREILRLVAWEQLAREEIATAMGLSRPAVRLRLHRARTRLAAVMASMDDLPAPSKKQAVQRTETTGHERTDHLLASATLKESR